MKDEEVGLEREREREREREQEDDSWEVQGEEKNGEARGVEKLRSADTTVSPEG